MLRPSIGTVIFGRYALRRELARGGMGSVWEAEDRKLRRSVAIKVLYPLWAESQDALMRFEREAMAVARLQSSHVVQIFDYGVDRECPFIVMELLTGEDLRVRIKRGGRLSLEQTSSIVVQTARALSAAHAMGIIHRDLKPGNVFLVRGREEDLVKVLDFGLAKARLGEDVDQETTKEGAILGTPRYMSPEQALQSSTVDFRTDLWSLAVIAFRALTGKVPFSGKSPADVIVRLCTQRPPRATEVAPHLPAKVDGFFERALQRKPEDRFRSARELAETFAHLVETCRPAVAMAAGSKPVKIGAVSRPIPRAITTTLAGMGPRPAGAVEEEDDEDEAPTIGIAGMSLASLADDADTEKVLELAHAKGTARRAPPPPRHRKRRGASFARRPDAASALAARRAEQLPGDYDGDEAPTIVEPPRSVPAAGGSEDGQGDFCDGDDDVPTTIDPPTLAAHGAARFGRIVAGVAALLVVILVVLVGALRMRSRAEDGSILLADEGPAGDRVEARGASSEPVSESSSESTESVSSEAVAEMAPQTSDQPPEPDQGPAAAPDPDPPSAVRPEPSTPATVPKPAPTEPAPEAVPSADSLPPIATPTAESPPSSTASPTAAPPATPSGPDPFADRL